MTYVDVPLTWTNSTPPSRYPDVYDEGSPFEYYTEKEAEECITRAEKILSWAKKEVL
ncbi:hypothetical protein HS7_11640 [Sulfolobales archaeon HS-7]|nr:hypothetical protein HS7_11640 [Sulfolobales archaeon HS-7]